MSSEVKLLTALLFLIIGKRFIEAGRDLLDKRKGVFMGRNLAKLKDFQEGRLWGE